MSLLRPTPRSIVVLSLLLLAACRPPAAPDAAPPAPTATLPAASASAREASPPAARAPSGASTEEEAQALAEKHRRDGERKAVDPLYEHALADIAAATCPTQDPEVCAWARGFLAGERPRFSGAEAWTLGTEALVSEHGTRESKTRYVIFRTKRDTGTSWMGTFSAFPETPAEEADCRAALAIVQAGDGATKNAFLDFIRGHLDAGAWAESTPEGKSLYFTEPGGRGTLIALRQKGDTLYIAQLILGGGAAGWDIQPGWVLGSAALRPLVAPRP